jgi:hypothetical protein
LAAGDLLTNSWRRARVRLNNRQRRVVCWAGAGRKRMSLGGRWLWSAVLYTLLAVSAYALGSTGWPGRFVVDAVEWASGSPGPSEPAHGG